MTERTGINKTISCCKLSFFKRLEITITYFVPVVYHGFAENTTLSLKLGNDVEGKSYLFLILIKNR